MRYWIDSILHGYSQIFFSLNKTFAIVIMLVTFINPFLGLCGFMAIFTINILAYIIGFNRELIREGLFGFNALLLGLAIGYEYKFNFAFVLLFLFAIILLLIFSIWLSNFLNRQRLPFLALPFLFTYWLVYFAAGSFSYVELREEHIYTANYVANVSQSPIYVFAHSLDQIALPKILLSFFKTLSATFFQNSVLAGICIAAALFFFSRIAFSLALLGFASAYYSFKMLGVDTIYLTDYLVGSNFIFFGIAIGGFYLIPNKWSYMAVVLLTPVLMILMFSLGKFMMIFQLKAFTLSFTLLTILFLYFLQYRWWQHSLQLIGIQYYSAEKTIYKFLSSSKRFKYAHLAKLQMPFWGYWKVSQGYNGSITHLGEWGKALDFVIIDQNDKTYKNHGTDVKDYYAYNKPVVAPFDGYIYDIINTTDDNAIGEVDTENNWGNTLIMNHNNGLFSQLSHLKKDSFKVKIGEYVKKGTVVASCGSTGRSPEPHLHFQLQLTPKVGEKTLSYPIAYYIDGKEDEKVLKSFEIPKENSIVSNVNTSKLLLDNFDISPGKKIKLSNQSEPNDEHLWEVFTDYANQTYIQCSKTKAKIWFVNDGVMFYCYDFEGNKRSLLFQFYLANYRVLLGCYQKIEVKDSFPLIHFNTPYLLWVQDILAPFYLFTKASYSMNCIETDNENNPAFIKIQSRAESWFLKKQISSRNFEMVFEKNKPAIFKVITKKGTNNYLCELTS